MRLLLLSLVVSLAGCKPVLEVAAPVIGQGNAGSQPAEIERKEPLAKQSPAVEKAPLIGLPPSVEMSAAGLELVLEFEVGGKWQYNKWPHPEYIGKGDRYSGVTWGIGYDAHQNSAAVILQDWTPYVGEVNARRLAATQPFYGTNAQMERAYAAVKDIVITWEQAVAVYQRVDVARTYAQCRRAFPDFINYRDHPRDAAISLSFNRGVSMAGDARREMREIRDIGAKPQKDYGAMADQYRRMPRVWEGKSIYAGMKRRRLAEAKLVEIDR
jgi:GH24 family phage-related lysozyme (muramidase)